MMNEALALADSTSCRKRSLTRSLTCSTCFFLLLLLLRAATLLEWQGYLLAGQDAAHLLEHFLRLLELVSARGGRGDALVPSHGGRLAHIGHEACVRSPEAGG